MELLDYKTFGKIRFVDFYPYEEELEKLKGFEYMGDYWVGEGIGFNHFLRLDKEPEITRAISISLEDIPKDITDKIFKKVGLPLQKKMNIGEIELVLGEAKKYLQFTKDRKTYEFIIGSKYLYYVSCTVHNANGLIYVVLMNHQETLDSLN